MRARHKQRELAGSAAPGNVHKSRRLRLWATTTRCRSCGSFWEHKDSEGRGPPRGAGIAEHPPLEAEGRRKGTQPLARRSSGPSQSREISRLPQPQPGTHTTAREIIQDTIAAAAAATRPLSRPGRNGRSPAAPRPARPIGSGAARLRPAAARAGRERSGARGESSARRPGQVCVRSCLFTQELSEQPS